MGNKKEENMKEAIKYSKEELLKSARFADRKDLVNVIVGDDESLTVAEVQVKIDGFMKGKVN